MLIDDCTPMYPGFRFNDLEYRWVGLSNWTYEVTFPLTRAQAAR